MGGAHRGREAATHGGPRPPLPALDKEEVVRALPLGAL